MAGPSGLDSVSYGAKGGLTSGGFLGLSLLLLLAFLVILLPLTVAGTAFGILTHGIGLLCLIPLFCIMISVIWIASLVLQQAELAIVIENLSIIDGVRRGWNVLSRMWAHCCSSG